MPQSIESNLVGEPVLVCGVPFTSLTVDQLHAYIKTTIQRGERRQVVHVNVYGVNLAQSDSRVMQIYRGADVVVCDGFGIRIGSYLLGRALPPRITYADWIWQLSAFAAENGYSLFFLGNEAGVAERAAAVLVERYPALQIVGTHHGFFDKTLGSAENKQVVEMINAARPNILLICLGMPRQEFWLEENWDALACNIALTPGAALTYVAGTVSRGPSLLTNYGFEWLARLLAEPRRLWRRYLLGNPKFLFCVLRQRLNGTQE